MSSNTSHRVIDLGKEKALLSLDWISVEPGRKQAKVISQLAKDAKSNLGFKQGTLNTESQIAFASKEYKKHFSAALAMASVFENLLHIEKIGNGEYWILLVHNHNILTTTDVIVNDEMIEDAIGELLDSINSIIQNDEEVDFVIHAPEDSVFEVFESKNQYTLENLISEINAKKFYPKNINQLNVIIGIAIAVAISVPTYGFISDYLNENKNKISEMIKSDQAKKEEEEARLSIIRGQILAEDKVWLSKSLNNMNWKAVSAIVHDIYYKYPEVHKGWKRGDIALSFDNKNNTVTLSSDWFRTKDGTYNSIDSIVERINNVEIFKSNNDFDKVHITSRHKVTPIEDEIPEDKLDDVLTARGKEVDNIISNFQLNEDRWKWEINAMNSIRRFQSVPSLPGAESNRFQYPLKGYSIKVSGGSYVDAANLIERLSSKGGFKLKGMSVSVSENDIMSWELNGEYYVK